MSYSSGLSFPQSSNQTIILGLGSNVGDSRAILSGAAAELRTILHDMRISSVYKTAPQEYVQQDDFFNLVVAGNYAGTPQELFMYTQSIESKYGRDRSKEIKKGPRTLDIDILFFGTQCIQQNNPALCIPHPAIEQRCFVLIPLLELFPAYRHPVSGKLLAEVCSLLGDQGVLKADSAFQFKSL
ncbi:MAG: 2-amino-4-hydroxy-6-hydroxymethyldihydropteridine diphosphokinase [Treponema sp.]